MWLTCWPSFAAPWCLIQKLLGAKGRGASEFPAQDWICQDLVLHDFASSPSSSNPTILSQFSKKNKCQHEKLLSFNQQSFVSPTMNLTFTQSPSILCFAPHFFLSSAWALDRSLNLAVPGCFFVAFQISQQWTLVESRIGAAVFHAPHPRFKAIFKPPATERDALILQGSEKQLFFQRKKVCIGMYTYIHACMHACIHTYIPTYLPTYIQTNTHTHTYVDLRTAP